jgi:hypothetical protein
LTWLRWTLVTLGAALALVSLLGVDRLSRLRVPNALGQARALALAPAMRPFVLPLNNPGTVPAALATHMQDADLVFGLGLGGRPRAYPQWILVGYHVVNDTLGRRPILVAHCEVCSAAAAFEPEVTLLPERSLSFMMCGIHAGTFEICDNQTLSRWHPFSGRAREGPLAGAVLPRLTIVLEEWGTWRRRFPTTDVVFAHRSLEERHHGRGPEFEIGAAFLPLPFRGTANLGDQRLAANTLVYGLLGDGGRRAVAVPREAVARSGNLRRVEIADAAYLIVTQGVYGATAFELPAPLRQQEFRVVSQEPFVIGTGAGGRWNELGAATEGSSVTSALPVAPGYLTEWYEWVSAFPASALIH